MSERVSERSAGCRPFGQPNPGGSGGGGMVTVIAVGSPAASGIGSDGALATCNPVNVFW
jgi:hypothetical protein